MISNSCGSYKTIVTNHNSSVCFTLKSVYKAGIREAVKDGEQTMLRHLKGFVMPEDLTPDDFPEIEWKTDNLEESVEKVFRYVVNEAGKSWRFYYDRRKSKRLMGQVIRLAMIVAGSVAVIIPILGEIYKTGDVPSIPPGWASIALAVAAFFGAMDKFGDFSGGRARYLVTGQKIYRDLEMFRFKWEESKLEREGKALDMATARHLVGECRIFHENVSETIRQEISQWKKAFKKSLSDKAGLPEKE